MARLEKVYSSVFGAEASKGQLYGGFYTMLAGVFAGFIAFVFFYVGNGKGAEANAYQWREAALAMGLLAGLAVFYGISLALPSKRGMRRVQIVALVVGAAAIGWFLRAYPLHFNVAGAPGQTDYTWQIVGLYGLGLAVLLAGTFTSLIGYYLDRVQAAQGGGRGAAGTDYFDEYEVPDSVIEKDIEYAMRKYRYAWGEGQSASSGVHINIKDDFEAGTVIGGGKGVARTVQLEAPQVDDATKALRSVRPGAKEKSMPTSEVDAQTNALLAFRKQKFEQMQAKQSVRKLGWWARIMVWLGLKKAPAPVTSPKS